MRRSLRITTLTLTTVLPGLFFAGYSAYYLFQDWGRLTQAYQRMESLNKGQPTVQQIMLAQAAEERHRINCFAEGLGVLAGWTIVAIGVHGLCQRD
jgi:hypothetical protein